MERILFVDDDPNILNAYRRRLRKVFRFDTAQGGEQALKMLNGTGRYAVVCTDMRMPGMDGLEFLTRVKKRSPDSVRLMLTGDGEQEVAMRAVNKGNVFRFLTKPCPPELMAEALVSAIKQYRLLRSEKELLSKTLKGAVEVLLEVLSLTSPVAFCRATAIRDYVRKLARELGIEDCWEFEVAALLSQIGCVTLPQEMLERLYRREPLTEIEKSAFENHPLVGSQLISKIPRLEEVARCIAFQEKRFDGSGQPDEVCKGRRIPLGARMLKVVGDLVALENVGVASQEAMARLSTRLGWYDPKILKALDRIVHGKQSLRSMTVKMERLVPGMILDQDIWSPENRLLLGRGHAVTSLLCERLRNLRDIMEPTPVRVLVPTSPAQELLAPNKRVKRPEQISRKGAKPQRPEKKRFANPVRQY